MKINRILTASLFASVTLFAASNIDKIKELKMFNKPGITITSYAEHESTYQVKGNVQNQGGVAPFEAFITKDLREVIFGRGFNAKTQKPLQVIIDTKAFIKDVAYTFGDGKDEYMLFTDPECPYCHQLEKILPLLKKNAKFHIFLYPLSFHKNAKPMSYFIMSQKTDKDKASVMHNIANELTDYKKAKFTLSEIEKYDELLKKQFDIASILGVSGTPALFDINGNPVQWNTLLKKYDIKEPVDMEGINFLNKSGLGITLSDKGHNESLYVFTSLDKNSNLDKIKAIVEKYGDNHSINLYLKLDRQMTSLNKLKVIYSQSDNKKRVELLNQLIENKKLDEALIVKAKAMTKDEETKYIPVSYVMQKMKLDTNKDFLIIDKDGKIVNE